MMWSERGHIATNALPDSSPDWGLARVLTEWERNGIHGVRASKLERSSRGPRARGMTTEQTVNRTIG